ncbi:MAG TPA: hypothetical protein VMR62_18990 [Bryobacteraceae bacterium]|nr:hypothetical protein [Bryobacteraceae bacterium]
MIVRLRLRPRPSVTALSAADRALFLQSGNPELFASMVRPRTRRWASILSSLALHIVIIGGAIYYLDNTRRAVVNLASKYSVRLLRFPPSLLQPTARGSSGDAHKPGTSAAPPGMFDALFPGLDTGPAPSTNVSDAAGPRRFEMPQVPVAAQSTQILLQPEFVLREPVKSDMRLPELLLWKPRRPQPTPVPRKIFVAQKRPEVPAPPENLPAPPVLESPNNELLFSDLAFTGRTASVSPWLPRPAGTTAPIRTIGRVEDGPLAQVAPPAAEDASPPNVVSIPEIPVPPAGVFRLPGGNQSAPAAPASGHETANGRSAAAVAVHIEDPGVSGSSGSPGHGSVVGTNETTGGQDTDKSAASRPVTKVVLPADGHFTVMIESSAANEFEGTEGALSGKVVYTVYVRVGAGKEWVLQYCLPQAVEQSLSLSGKRMPMEAPYPYLMLRPELSFGPDVDYVILHGMVTAEGKFDQLSYVTEPEEQSEKDQLLHSLQQWQLRPGKMDGKPIALEILLIIPGNRP